MGRSLALSISTDKCSVLNIGGKCVPYVPISINGALLPYVTIPSHCHAQFRDYSHFHPIPMQWTEILIMNLLAISVKKNKSAEKCNTLNSTQKTDGIMTV